MKRLWRYHPMTICCLLVLSNMYLYSLPLRRPGFTLEGSLNITLLRPEFARTTRDRYEQLTLFTLSGKKQRIAELSDLSGYCQLETPGQALSFVRLRTSPTTFSLFYQDGTSWLEPLSVKAVTRDLLFGVAVPSVSDLVEHANMRNAIVRSRSDLVSREPVVKREGRGFKISRVIEVFRAFDAGGKGKAHFVVEQVSTNGRYEVISMQSLGKSTDTTAYSFATDRALYASGGGRS